MTPVLSDVDKKIYNLFLSTTRSKSGKPFKLRQNFDNLDENISADLKKLSSLFLRVPHLFCKEFFEAPFEVLGEGYYDLSFYASPKSIGTFNKFLKNKDEKDPDDQIERIKDSYKFIYVYCKDRKIRLNQYPFFKTISIEDCLKHIKDRYVSMYIIFSFPELYSLIINLDSDVYSLFFGDMDIQNLQLKMTRSKKAFVLSQKLYEIVSKKLEENLANGVPS